MIEFRNTHGETVRWTVQDGMLWRKWSNTEEPEPLHITVTRTEDLRACIVAIKWFFSSHGSFKGEQTHWEPVMDAWDILAAAMPKRQRMTARKLQIAAAALALEGGQ